MTASSSTNTRALYACPAAGRVVRVSGRPETGDRIEAPCPTCTRVVRVRVRYDRRARAYLATLPRHARADVLTELRDARRAGVEVGRARCEAAQASRAARRTAKKRACSAGPAFRRAERAASKLPPPELARRMRQISFREEQAARACARQRLEDMPRDPRKLLNRLLDVSGIDAGAVEPDTFFELLTTYLPPARVKPLANLRPTRLVRAGLEALIRYAKPRSWDDLERAPFGGQESLLAVIRSFPGLEAMRLPDAAYARSVEAHGWGEWDAGALPF